MCGRGVNRGLPLPHILLPVLYDCFSYCVWSEYFANSDFIDIFSYSVAMVSDILPLVLLIFNDCPYLDIQCFVPYLEKSYICVII